MSKAVAGVALTLIGIGAVLFVVQVRCLTPVKYLMSSAR